MNQLRLVFRSAHIAAVDRMDGQQLSLGTPGFAWVQRYLQGDGGLLTFDAHQVAIQSGKFIVLLNPSQHYTLCIK